MSGVQGIVERIEREQVGSDVIELSVSQVTALLEEARNQGLQEMRNQIPGIKVHIKKRGYNAQQAIGHIDRLLSLLMEKE